MIANDTRPGPPGKTMLICPVNGCPWRYQQTGPDAVNHIWLATVEDTIAARLDIANRADERAIREHLAEHPIEDFLRTIAELRDQLAAAAVV